MSMTNEELLLAMAEMMDTKLAANLKPIENRLDRMDDRLDQHDKRFEVMEKRFEVMEKRKRQIR